jgi:hypothetical protein
MAAWLETFGRHRLDPVNSRVGDARLWERVGVLYEEAKIDRDGFLADLAQFVTDDRGGFRTLGAAGLAWEFYSEDALRIPGALVLIDAGIAVKTARGLPGAAFTGYEWERIQQLRDRAR